MTKQEQIAEQIGVIDGCLTQLVFHAEQLRQGVNITSQHLGLRQHLLAFALPLVERALQTPTADLNQFSATVTEAKDAMMRELNRFLQEA